MKEQIYNRLQIERGKEKEGLVQAQCTHLCSPQRPGTGAAPESISPCSFMLVPITGHTGLALAKVEWSLGSERMKIYMYIFDLY